MELKAVSLFLIIGLSTCLIQNAFAKPRDSTAVEEESVVPINSDTLDRKEEVTTEAEKITTDIKIPGRIPCEFDEATEDTVCQAHCLPKGYTYGICVSHTCSCI